MYLHKLTARLHNNFLIQFLLIGAAIYLVYSHWFYDKPTEYIQITSQQLKEASQQWLKETGKLPSLEQRALIITQLSNNEILFRQALNRQYDLLPIVRRRLINLADFLELTAPDSTEESRYQSAIETGLVVRDGMIRQYLITAMRQQYIGSLSEETIPANELHEYFQKNLIQYIRPAKAQISHVYFGSANGGASDNTRQRAARARATLALQPNNPVIAIKLGDPFYGSYHLPMQIERQISSQLGATVAAAAIDLPLENWSEPIESPYGYHLIWIHQRIPASTPHLNEVKEDVIARIRRREQGRGFNALMTTLRETYQIELPNEAR